MRGNDPFAEALKRLADGAPIDWTAVDSEDAPESLRARIEPLKIIAAVAEIARSLPAHSEQARGDDLLTWGHLKILARVGGGAFGDVYRAWDSRLDREVALKIQKRPDDSASSSIIDEGRLLARVRHPNIAAVYGADRLGDTVGIWMEFINGRTLTDLVDDEGPRTASEVAATGIDLCRALAAVHDAGLVHGDVKARNVMRDDAGRIVLMDFGAGTDLRDACSGPAGTPLYLAPELLRGGRATPQADVYSLGVLLFHLLTEDFPVRGNTLLDVRDAHERGVRVYLDAAAPGLPPALMGAIERALSADPADRYPTAAEFEAALAVSLAPIRRRSRPLFITGAAAALAVAGLGLWWTLRPEPAPFPERAFVVIVTFENRTGDRTLDGVVEAGLERELTNSRHVNVAPQDRIDDALRLMKKPPGTRLDVALAKEVALRDGGIRAVLRGSLDGNGGAITVTAEMLDPAAAAGSQEVLARHSERSIEIPRLYTAIQRTSDALRRQLGERSESIQRETPPERVSTRSLDALRLYSESYRQGTQLSGTRNWAAAQTLVREALARDPDFAVAHTWHAWTLFRAMAPADDIRVAAAKGVALSDHVTDWERHWIRGSYSFLTDDLNGAAREYEALLRVNPDHLWGVWNLQNTYDRLGRYRDAVRIAEMAARLRPAYATAQHRAADALSRVSRRADAVPYLDRFAQLRGAEDPVVRRLSTWRDFIGAFDALDRRDPGGVLAVVERVRTTLSQRQPAERDVVIRYLTFFYAALGKFRDASAVALETSDVRRRAVLMAEIHSARGDGAPARALIEQAALHVDFKSPAPPQGDQQPFTAMLWLSARLGTSTGRRLVDEWNSVAWGPEGRSFVQGAFALHRGDTRESERRLAEFRAVPIPGSHLWYRAMIGLGESLGKQGRYRDAASVLTDVVKMTRTEAAGHPSGHIWIPAQVELARLRRKLGDEGGARQLLDDLAKLLSQADPDFPLLTEVRTLSRSR